MERHLHGRLGELVQLEYDLLLYDMTSTYFEGLVAGNPQACHGYSRDHRSDCKQVCLALVVSREGLPLGYEVFAVRSCSSCIGRSAGIRWRGLRRVLSSRA